jgi:hypothetical protein
MADPQLRQAIAYEAARLLHEEVESDFNAAKRKAARRFHRGWCPDEDFPTNAEVRQLLLTMAHHDPAIPGNQTEKGGHYSIFRMMLQPLAGVAQDRERHPEGDVLYHSLQVFSLAKEHRPYDVEFLLAALLHDVGKGIEPRKHIAAAIRSLDGLITDRTRFLIENHNLAHDYRDGSLPPKLRDKLRSHPDFDDLLLLAECDRAGRVPGAVVESLDDVLSYLQDLEAENEGS